MKNTYIYILGFAVVTFLLIGLIFTLSIEGDTEDIFEEKYTINIHNCSPIESDTIKIVEEIKSMLYSTDVKSHFLIPIVKVIVNDKAVNKFSAIPIYGMNYISYLSSPDMLTFASHKEDEDYFFKSINDNSDFKDFMELLANGNAVESVKPAPKNPGPLEFIINPGDTSSNKEENHYSSFKELRKYLDSLIQNKEIKKGYEIDVFYSCGPTINSISELNINERFVGAFVSNKDGEHEAEGKKYIVKDGKITQIEELVENPDDFDHDGITNDEDNCPKKYGPKENNGCPIEIPVLDSDDNDQDGVSNIDDECPDEYGHKDNNGCPNFKVQYESENLGFRVYSNLPEDHKSKSKYTMKVEVVGKHTSAKKKISESIKIDPYQSYLFPKNKDQADSAFKLWSAADQKKLNEVEVQIIIFKDGQKLQTLKPVTPIGGWKFGCNDSEHCGFTKN